MAISWYDPPKYTAETDIVPGDCHAPKGARNDAVIGTQQAGKNGTGTLFPMREVHKKGGVIL